MLWILIFDTRLYCTAENRLVNDLDWNQQSDCSVRTNSHYLPCREAVQILLVTGTVQLRCDAVSMTSSPSSSLPFSLLAAIFRTTLNKITSRRFQLYLLKAQFCSGISFHLFIFTYSSAFAIPQAKRTKQIFEFFAVWKRPNIEFASGFTKVNQGRRIAHASIR